MLCDNNNSDFFNLAYQLLKHSSAKACALCHYRWIDTFFIEGRGSEFVDYTSEKVVATAEMAGGIKTGNHPVGSSELEIPR